MVVMKDFEDAEGHLNWEAYREAQRKAGERCCKCDAFIFGNKGYTQCSECSRLHQNDRVYHKRFIRCPHCSHLRTPDFDTHCLYHEGEHDIQCDCCDQKFTVSTHITYEFESPPLISESIEQSMHESEEDIEDPEES